jgi:phospholipase C
MVALPHVPKWLPVAAVWLPAGALHAQSQLAQAQAHISHVIVIMQENRSFDSYFGTFPGADGIALNAAGTPSMCYPLATGSSNCVIPFHDRQDINAGGQHNYSSSLTCIDQGAMDGFLINQITGSNACDPDGDDLNCPALLAGLAINDAVGYHTSDEIPNYWTYASTFVLQDHLFEPVTDYSLMAHLYMISAWTATCVDRHDPMSCTSALGLNKNTIPERAFAWSSIADLLDGANVSWKYYLPNGAEPDCDDGAFTCTPNQMVSSSQQSIWNPLPGFDSIQQKNAIQPTYIHTHVPPFDQFYKDINKGTLPNVSWIVPSANESEHPPNGVQEGMEYTTALINTVMQSRYWNSTVIFLAWDDWGGFFDHENPPIADYAPNPSGGTTIPLGYGIRVPGLIISPWVYPGYIDHQVVSFDAYLKFIEDIFLSSARIGALGTVRPDSRTTIREALTSIAQAPSPGNAGGAPVAVGDLLNDFNFSQAPLPPLILSTLIPTNFVGAIDAEGNYHFPLTWNPVTTGPISGYNVWRTTTSGSGYQLVAGCSLSGTTQFTGTSCTDTTAVPGTPYYYIITTIAANGTQSPNSAEMDITP